jgi:biopolymer transport protein ExbD
MTAGRSHGLVTTRRALTLALVLVVSLRLDGALGQAETHVRIRVLSAETCLVFELHVPCKEVGAKLRELGTPTAVTVSVGAEKEATYQAIASTLEALKREGFRAKLGSISAAGQ